MPRSSHIAGLLSALALVFPGAALAQGSASGDTYQDPFSNQSGGGHHGGGSSSGSGTQGTSSGGTSGNSTSGSGSSPTATTASTSSNGQSGPASSSGSNGKLPRTGLDASIFAFVGAVLIASGVAIRRRIPAFWR